MYTFHIFGADNGRERHSEFVASKYEIGTISTSVSETIRKPPLAEAQIALRKQKNTFCGTWVAYLFHCRHSAKNGFLA